MKNVFDYMAEEMANGGLSKESEGLYELLEDVFGKEAVEVSLNDAVARRTAG